MARTSPGPEGERARLFVALDLPDAARAALAAWRDELVAGRRDLRPVPPEALHVTLAFLGWRDVADVERIGAAAVRAAAACEAPVLGPTAVRPVPPRRPRLFALDLADADGRGAALQAAVSEALAAERFYRPEERPFWPHVTLARVPKRERPGPLSPAPPPLEPFEASRVTLYRSHLHAQGSVYEPLVRGPVGSG